MKAEWRLTKPRIVYIVHHLLKVHFLWWGIKFIKLVIAAIGHGFSLFDTLPKENKNAIFLKVSLELKSQTEPTLYPIAALQMQNSSVFEANNCTFSRGMITYSINAAITCS